MLENWVWEPKVLKEISSHYETQEPLPDDLIKELIESRRVNVALGHLYQIFYARFDMEVHGPAETDYTTLWHDLSQTTTLLAGPDSPLPGHGDFTHLAGGYSAGYYGYMYSSVFAADMYATMFKEDPLSPELGKKFKDTILVPGGSRDAIDLLKEFLGRLPNENAFIKRLFGDSEAVVSESDHPTGGVSTEC